MSSASVHELIMMLLRWTHLFFGIAWIGHLYYFNFVQGSAEKALDGPMKKIVVPNFRGRAFWWFRWGAMITFLSGITYILYEQFIETNNHFGNWFGDSRGIWITFGMLLGSIMWFNVWFVIWPRQQVIIASVGGLREKPGDFDALVAAAGKASRLNTYLSVPMLFGMGARKHLVSLSPSMNWVMVAVVFAVGFGISYHVVNSVAGKVGKEFLPPAPPAPPAAAAPPPAAK
jgi:uncharacterized membrane protein